MEGNKKENLSFTQNVKKRGYETVVPLSFSGNFLAANALDANGNVLATSDVWDLALGASVSSTLPLRYDKNLSQRDICTHASIFFSQHEAGAVGRCMFGCGRLDDFDHMLVLLTAFTGILLVIMWLARRRKL
jgi:hypothetical protein